MEGTQSTLALPEIKKKETREALQAVFKTYRNYKEILRMGFEPLTIVTTMQGYENAYEPSTIKAQYKYNDGIKMGFDPWDITERKCTDFINLIDRKVNGMLPFRREVIQLKYLCEEDPIPTDDEVIMELERLGYFIPSKRDFERKKANALHRLACSLGLEKWGTL